MDGPEPGLASVVLDEEGRYLDADAAALETYGVALVELRTHRVGDFSEPRLARVHRALFLWLAARDHDFGGGQSTIVRPDRRRVRIACRSLTRAGGTYRMLFRALDDEVVPPHSEDLAAVLDAWRTADREAAAGDAAPSPGLSGEVATALRAVYHYVFARKSVRAAAPPPPEPATADRVGV